MGNGASIPPEMFEKMRAEFEAKKGSLSDEALFNHMKTFYDNLQGEVAAVAVVAEEPSVAVVEGDAGVAAS